MTAVIDHLDKRIGAARVLEDICLTVSDGTVVGLSGPNGSGKTMLMRALVGLIRPTNGTVVVDGKRLWRDAAFPRSVGVLLENPAFLDSRTGFDNLKILAKIKGCVGRKRRDKETIRVMVSRALERVGLDPHDKRKYRKYSLGMKQRLGIAAAIMEEPTLIVLDEPMNALDFHGVDLAREIIEEEKQRGAAIVLACHDAVLLRELSDEICFMDRGRIVKREEVAK